MEIFLTQETLIALLTLTLMETVLGIDNIVFISILSSRLPASEQNTARRSGLILALFMRILLLFSLSWLMGLTAEIFSIWDQGFSGRDLILLGGGLFLIAKATFEIHDKLEGPEEDDNNNAKAATLAGVLVQIVLLDSVFSLDSVITAIGMAEQIAVMIAAVVLSMLIMLFAMNPISNFVERHPTVKMLALSFLLLIGVTLIAEGVHFHISKGYVYFAMAFSLFVEMLNLKLRRSGKKPVKLKRPSVVATRERPSKS